MSIDRADWHWEDTEKQYREVHGITGELTAEQANEVWLLAANHIGLFLRWIIERGFEGEDAVPEDCERVRSGQMTGAEYLMENCDGKLWDSDIREDILPFVQQYYEEGSEYLDNYIACCLGDDKPCYGVITNEEDYARLKERNDAAYERYLKEEQ